MKVLRKHGASGALIAALAAVALIAAQAAIIGHDLGDDSHASDSVCEFCIAGTSLAGANVGAAKTVFRRAFPSGYPVRCTVYATRNS